MFGEDKPRGFDGTDWANGFLWALQKSFVAYEKDSWLESFGLMEKNKAEEALDANLNSLEKFIAYFGYTYVRGTNEDKIIIFRKQFEKLMYEESFKNINRLDKNITFY